LRHFTKSKYFDETTSSSKFLSIKRQFEKEKNAYELKKKELQVATNEYKGFEKKYDNLLIFHELFQKAAEVTQKKLEFKISELVSTAEAAVFPEPYDFIVRFLTRRKQTECDLIFAKNGKEYGDALYSSGGGPVDVASFALRCSFWCINKTRKVLILDEPFRFVNDDPTTETRELQKKCVEMLKMVADKLGLQIIVVSTLPEFLNIADKTFNVSLDKNGISQMKVIKGQDDTTIKT